MAYNRRANIIVATLIAALVASVLGDTGKSCAAELVAQTIVEKETVYLGETITVTVLVSGSDSARAPDLSSADDFRIRFVSGESMRTDAQRSYAFQYLFVPKRVGNLTIPSLSLTVHDREVTTRPVTIAVLAPEKTDELRLVTALSKNTCFVGEPLTLTVTWYIALPGQVIKAVDLRLPILRDPRFRTLEPAAPIDGSSPNAVGVPVSDTRVIAERGRGSLDGEEFTTLTFRKTVVPQAAGRIEVPSGTVLCTSIPSSARNRRSWNQYPSYFDNDFFDGDVSGRYRRYFATSEPIVLDVAPLPPEGRPVFFTGLVLNSCSLSAAARPTTVSVGAPVTLTIRVTASDYLETIELPTLRAQADLTRDFDIPSERSAGSIEGNVKVFSQTLRPKSADVHTIPPVRLAYFDPDTETYEVTQSDPISVSVTDAHVVTGADLAGADEHGAQNARGPYEPVFWLCTVLILALVCAVVVLLRRREQTVIEVPHGREAYPEFERRLRHLRERLPEDDVAAYTAIEKALRGYWADRLHLPPGALTYPDVAGSLKSRQPDDEIMAALERISKVCRAHRFGGGADVHTDPRADIELAARTIEKLEATLDHVRP